MAESYARGPQSPQLLTQTIGKKFDEIAGTWPDREALIVRDQGVRYTWAQLAEQVDCYARALMALGLEKGERVGIWAPNCAEWAITQFATAKAGLIMVNINPAYRRHELEYTLKQSGCAWVICAERFKSSDYQRILLDLVPELASARAGEVSSDILPGLRGVVTLAAQAPGEGFITWQQLGARANQVSEQALA